MVRTNVVFSIQLVLMLIVSLSFGDKARFETGKDQSGLTKTPNRTPLNKDIVLKHSGLTDNPRYFIKGGKSSNDEEEHHKIGVTGLVVNIVADLCPHGMLPLAYGIAKDGPTGCFPAVALLVLFCSLSAYSMSSLGHIAQRTNSKTISEMWGNLISKNSKWIVDWAIFALCFGCCVFYSAFIGDIFTALATAAGFPAKRWIVLGVISFGALLPLCLLEDLSALQFSTFFGVVGIIYTVVFHCLRLFDGTYSGNSPMLRHIPPKLYPIWPVPKMNAFRVSSGTLVLGNMMCVAFLAHYNAINYSRELADYSLKRLNTAIAFGFGISCAVFMTMMFVGYFLFGLSAQPLILNNFPMTQDVLATYARIGTGAAIAFAYPLMFAGLKGSMYSILEGTSLTKKIKVKTVVEVNSTMVNETLSTPPNVPSISQSKNGKFSNNNIAPIEVPLEDANNTIEVVKLKSKKILPTNVKTISVVSVVTLLTAIAMNCGEEDVSLVLGFVGSILGCFTAYILPGILGLRYLIKRYNAKKKISGSDVFVHVSLIFLGIIFSALGVWITLTDGSHH